MLLPPLKRAAYHASPRSLTRYGMPAADIFLINLYISSSSMLACMRGEAWDDVWPDTWKRAADQFFLICI